MPPRAGPVMVGPPWKPTWEPPNKDVGKGNAPTGDVNDDVDMVKKSGFMWPVEFSTKVILILSLDQHGYYYRIIVVVIVILEVKRNDFIYFMGFVQFSELLWYGVTPASCWLLLAQSSK